MQPKSPPAEKPAPKDSLSRPRKAALWVIESIFSKVEYWVAAVWLGAAGVFLSLAWVSGPQQAVDAVRYAKFTGQVPGNIVDSWLAVDLNPRDVRNPKYWRARAFASPCMVIEYRGDWSPDATRRAYCGNRLPLSNEYTLAGVVELAPGVPFRWPHEARGFIVPEIRIDETARQWLAAGPPVDTFMHAKRPAKTMLDELVFDLDEPVDAAIAGWLATPTQVPLAYDPQHPDQALPSAVVAARANAGLNWIAVLIGATAGLIAWIKGMSIFPWLSGLAAPGRWILTLLPLATLPWWGSYFPRAIAYFNPQFGSVIRDVFADIGQTSRFVDSTPEDAILARGTRLVWDSGTSVYAESLGRFKLTAPTPAPPSPDAALAILASSVQSQVKALDEAGKVELFVRLKRDVDSDLDHAGIVFLPAAKDAVLARSSSEAPARAAHRFLNAWSNTQHLHAHEQLAQAERERLARAGENLPWE